MSSSCTLTFYRIYSVENYSLCIFFAYQTKILFCVGLNVLDCWESTCSWNYSSFPEFIQISGGLRGINAEDFLVS